jgi:hypothetical protein
MYLVATGLDVIIELMLMWLASFHSNLLLLQTTLTSFHPRSPQFPSVVTL